MTRRALFFALTLTACVPPRAPAKLAPRLEVASQERFGRVRSLIDELNTKRTEQVRIRCGQDSAAEEEVVDLPPTRQANGLDVLVVTSVKASGARIGTAPVLEAGDVMRMTTVAAPLAAHGKTVALVRAQDATPVVDVVHVIRALKGAGFAAVVLSTTSADAELTPEDWPDAGGKCEFPDGSETVGGAALVDVTTGDDGRPAVIRIVEAESGADAYAAAVCASRKRIDPEKNTYDKQAARMSLRKRLFFDTPRMKTPRDP